MANNESQEMYLETILKLQNRNGNVRSIDIAAELDYSKPSVSRAVGILKNDGYITVALDGVITLTDSGRDKAVKIFNRHKVLTEAFIKTGLPAIEAEENACKVEHVISEDAFKAIKNYFDL